MCVIEHIIRFTQAPQCPEDDMAEPNGHEPCLSEKKHL